ncbi:MAG: sigma-70 family RNA polymerase sigma factor [Anaerolineales bacterium]|nr:sigma-70 family RNA polymerase sigma factor [Anaerolineales bacterium]
MENLIQTNEGLIHAYLQRQVIGGMCYEDLVQEGRLALWQAVLNYDPQRGTTFSTYAWVVIRNQVWRSIRYANQSHFWVDEDEIWQPAREIAEAVCQAGQIQQALLETVARLPGRLKTVIVWVYGLDGQPPRTMADLGREWGLTRERIRQLRNDALTLLRLPSNSAELRDLCEQQSRQAYRRAQELNTFWLGRRRRP